MHIAHWIKFALNLAIPLVIGICTFVISLQQEKSIENYLNENRLTRVRRHEEDLERTRLQSEENRRIRRAQRDEDRELIRLQRNEDRKLILTQIEEDQQLERIQREQDQEIARQQRADDRKAAILKIELEQLLANDSRIQIDELAENQRNLYRNQRFHKLQMTQETNHRYDEILKNYQHEIFEIIQQRSQNEEVLLASETRMVLEMLDVQRRNIVFRIVQQIYDFHPKLKQREMLLFQSNLSGVDFNQLSSNQTLPKLEQVDARYASFRSMSLSNLPSFDLSNFDYTDWSFTKLTNSCFRDRMTLNHALFTQSNLVHIDFIEISINNISFENNQICLHCGFVETPMSNVRFENSTFSQSTFLNLIISDGNFRSSSFINSTFEQITFIRVDFSFAVFQKCIFTLVVLINCTVSNVFVNETNFSFE